MRTIIPCAYTGVEFSVSDHGLDAYPRYLDFRMLVRASGEEDEEVIYAHVLVTDFYAFMRDLQRWCREHDEATD